MRPSRRTERLNGLLLAEISKAVRRVVRDPRIEGVTFTGVNVTRDLRIARVYYSVLGKSDSQEAAHEGLQSAKGVIKRELSRNLDLRYMPEIDFFFDDTLQYAEHIEKLLKKVQITEA